MINSGAVRKVFESSLKLRSGESCLVVTDTLKKDIGEAFYNAALKITRKTKIIIIEPTAEHGAEPHDDVAREMLNYDVELLITDRSLTHTSARKEATKRGARIATMPSITEDMANRCLDVDYEEMRKRSEHLYGILNKASTVHMRTEAGTDIIFEVGNGKFFGENGGILDFPGAYGNLPEGEIAFAPETCEGVYVVDVSFADYGILVSPLFFKVKGGVVVEIEGEGSRSLVERLDRAGARAYKVAELGIGLNVKATITGNILEDEKVIGTSHVAVGNNTSFGGKNDVQLHLDGVINKPDITVDGKKLMERGCFLEGTIPTA
ncbi:MAG: aminopeptidase [Candidatus Omnitrophota bacterium]